MSAEPKGKRRGRPRDAAKREAMLDAATTLFLRHGGDAVTVDQVIAAANVSRATYYTNFADRNALLVAVISRQSERIARGDGAEREGDDTLREALIRYGERLVGFLANPDALGWEPLILHMRRQQPELAASFFDIGPRRAWAELERIIADGQQRGELRRVALAQAVGDLVGLWQGCWRVELVYGHREPPGDAEIRDRAEHGVDVFLRAYGTGRPIAPGSCARERRSCIVPPSKGDGIS